MKVNYNGMEIYILDDYDEVSRKASQILASQVTLKPDSVLGLATGSTPEGMYKLLVEMYKDGILDFSEVVTYNLDEYCNISLDNEQSYHYYMNEKLFKHVNLKKENINIPSGNAEDINGFCKAYDESILKLGKIDLQVLGIGTNGHIGFNEPNVNFEASTHFVKLDEKTIEANSRFFDKKEDVPQSAITVGIKSIMQSKKIVLMATGDTKKDVVEQMIFGSVTPNLQASILQIHQNVTIIVDKKAGSKIIDKLK